MALPGKKKKPDVGIELLLGAEPEEGEEPAEDGEEMDLAEFAEDDEFADEETDTDPLAAMAEGEEDMPTVDPEHAALAEKLGFTDPEQQQALVDLIQLVLSSDTESPPMGKESGALPPLPESAY
jgi:hypothetical protein